MNTAFTHAEGDLDVTVAYYAASQMVAFTADQFGFPKITRALELWGEGKTTAQVLPEAFGVSPQGVRRALPRVGDRRGSPRYDGQYIFDPQAAAGGRGGRGRRGGAPTERRGARRVRGRAPPRQEGRRGGARARRGAEARPERPRRALRRVEARGPAEGPRRRKRSTSARSRPRAATGYTVRDGAGRAWPTRGKDDAGDARGARGGAPLRPDAGRPAARALRARDRRQARRRRARGAARDRAARPARPRARTGCCSTSSSTRKQWDEARAVGEAALFVDVESADDPRRLRAGALRDGRPREGGLRAGERAPVRREAGGARGDPGAPRGRTALARRRRRRPRSPGRGPPRRPSVQRSAGAEDL